MGTAYLQQLVEKAKKNVRTIVLPEGEDERILKAGHYLASVKAAKIIILGNKAEIEAFYDKNYFSREGIEIVTPEESPYMEELSQKFYELRKDKGVSLEEAKKQMLNYNYFATMMVKTGYAEGMVSGANHSTAETVRPALQIIKSAQKGKSVSSCFVMVSSDFEMIMSDCALIINPNAQELADIALDAANTALMLGIEPRVAMLSYSSRGSGKGESVDKVREATKIAKKQLELPEYKGLGILLDGELQSDAAISKVVADKKAPDSVLEGRANVLVMPNIDAGNIGYKLVQRLTGAEAYGPLLQGLNAPINDLSRGASVEDIVGMIAITCLQANK